MNIEKVYDVLVVGGGIAGIAAALEAARSGLHTALVEKTILWGGLATSGLVPVYMPLCDGGGRQVTFGIAEELLEWSIKYGPGHIPAGWLDEKQEEYDTRFKNLYTQGKLDIRYATIFSPVAFAWGLDEVLYESGVDLWLDTLACQPMMVGNRVTGVEVENKSGRIAIRASCVVDTSGDADIAYRAGAPCEEQGSFPSYLGQYTSLALAREAVADNQTSLGKITRRVPGNMQPRAVRMLPSSLWRVGELPGRKWGHNKGWAAIPAGRICIRPRFRLWPNSG
jgi:glycine/D-amino acid oxidase-like deaminating enzyme